ncbi:alternate-type signal peptide domain-containing protein [Microbacterium sp. NPDC058345]|uniref:alternate-type signal peptide domain-containing protein n=1 Tax=Microbacterium sp. NPDC058345 TaxID=3346455 RepID=UPI00365919A4
METTASARAARPAPKARTKAIVAIAAGAALLLGGGTTLAYWSTSETLGAVTVGSGDLAISTPGAQTWTLNGNPVADITDVSIVPGDVVTATQTATLTLVGDNLEATLAATLTGAELPADVIAPTPTVSVPEVTDITALTPENANGKTVTVTVSYTFPAETENRDLTNAKFEFGSVALTLTQNT